MLRVHTYVPAGFRHFPHESARNSCLDSSTRNLAENHSGIVRKIRARPRGYPRPSAPENRGIPRKNVSYPCQVPYEPLADWLALFSVDVQGFKHYSFPVASVNFTGLGGVRVLLVLVSPGVE